MLIAVSAAGPADCPQVPESFEESLRLYIAETEGERLVAVCEDPGQDGLGFAEKTIEYGCEAIACGRFLTAPAFDRLADACVTRYYAAGLPLWEAAQAAERSLLPLLTAYEGEPGCGSRKHTHNGRDRAENE